MSHCSQLFTKLEECIRRRKLNTSSIREEILRILCNEARCMDSDQLHTLINAQYPKKVSQNTVYRTLRLLESCKLIVSIPTLQNKLKYCIYDEGKVMCFYLCTDCGTVVKSKLSDLKVLNHAQEEAVSLVLYHHRCAKCRLQNDT